MTNETLIDELLREQQRLTAVDIFSRAHDLGTVPEQAKYYRDLIPLHQPGPEEQFAFEVNLDTCSGCKACVTACHNLNGLDEGETWRNVGVLFGGTWVDPVQKTVTTACHHCVDPGCLNGCPVLAYEKDAVTGIVRHLDDQCIGCQYCVMKCPYDVPKYSTKRGIVRKCDMCYDRLTHEEAPACVQACPNEAIAIRIVSVTTMRRRAEVGAFLPDSPVPSYTIPTTRYVSKNSGDVSLEAGNHFALHPEHAHVPLVIMLVLTQFSVGLFALDFFLRLDDSTGVQSPERPFLALLLGLAGLISSTLHLGQPFKAWRAFLNLRHSWMSREIILFGVWFNLAVLYTASCWSGTFVLFHQLPEGDFLGHALALVRVGLGVGMLLTGLVSVFCSVMIYVDTQREFWNFPRTAGRFFGTLILLGTVSGLFIATWKNEPIREWVCALLILTFLKFLLEVEPFFYLREGPRNQLNRTAHLLLGQLRWLSYGRFVFLGLGGILCPLLLLATPWAGLAALSLVFCLVGEFSERASYFMGVSPDRMPGGLT